MNAILKPDVRPANPRFSSGPCTKRPGWTPEALSDAFVGRSHRHRDGKAKLQEVLDRTRAVLGIPGDYLIGIIPGSDTGAMEAALWGLLGARGVDVLSWENFGAQWAKDVTEELRLADVRVLEAPYGALPDLTQVDFDRDVVFVWNGTTSGVRPANGDWIPAARQGLTLCDATSAVYSQDLPWPKLDAVTWSWQKVMGGEAAHGMLVLSPRAVERLESHTPAWPIPKVLRLTKGAKLNPEPFEGVTLNTPSMLCVEDAIDGLRWAESIGGLKALFARTEANYTALAGWVEGADWIDFLSPDPAIRSNTSVCLKIVDPWLGAQSEDFQAAVGKRLNAMLEAEGAAQDIAAHRASPPGLRIWTGATIETADVKALTPWLDWAWATLKVETEAAMDGEKADA